MVELEALPAREGDCLWLRYGDVERPKQILIDGGRAATGRLLKARLAALAPERRHFELLVVTHIDQDHIEGLLELLEDPALPASFGDVWFNGYRHLHDPPLDTFGAAQAERLSAAIRARGLSWNEAFAGGPVRLDTQVGPRTIALAGGLELTVLSPDANQLAALIPRWEHECQLAGLIAGGEPPVLDPQLETLGGQLNVELLANCKYVPDRTAPNGSSIALLAQVKGRQLLLAADAHVDRLVASIQSMTKESAPLRLDAFKLSHHGSAGNVSQELLEHLDCRNYVISTDGSRFGHPSDIAIARVLKFGGRGKHLYFNARSTQTVRWDNAALKKRYHYETHFPINGEGGIVLNL